MPINLDFVGLNTLVREEIDTDTNTIGKASTKCIQVPHEVGDLTFGLTNSSLSGYNSGPFSFCFWAKVDDHQGENRYFFKDPTLDHFYLQLSNAGSLQLQLDDGASNAKQYFWTNLFDPSPYNFDWTHFCVTWNSFDSDPVLYLNGIAQVSSPIIYGSITSRAALSAINVGTYSTTSGELAGFMQHLAFFNKNLNLSEVTEIYSDGFISNLKNTSVAEYIVDYWQLGDEDELSSSNIGDEIVSGFVIEPTIGSNTLTSAGGVFIGRGNSKETRNQLIATVPYGNYLVALNTHRNGPYGYPTFKQLRASDNPITRYHNKNNIFSYVSDDGEERVKIIDGQVVSRHRDKHSSIKNLNETVVSSNSKPLSSVVNVTITEDSEVYEEKLILSTPFDNEITYFKNDELNQLHNLNKKDHKNYQDFKDLYMKVPIDDSIITTVESVKYEQTVYPTNLYMGKNYVRQRKNYTSGFWRSKRTDRSERDVTNGFGHIIPSQSMWPLDSDENFTSQTLAGDLGSFKIYGPSTLTASSAASDPNGTGSAMLGIPSHTTIKGLKLGIRTGSVIPVGAYGGAETSTQWAVKASSVDENNLITISTSGKTYGDHLVAACTNFWDKVSDFFITDLNYESVTKTETIKSRKGIYFSDLGNADSKSSKQRVVEVVGVNNNMVKPVAATKTENYRQHWASSSVRSGLTFWGGLYNHPTDSYDTFLFEACATNGASSNTSVGYNSTDIKALKKQVYFSTGSQRLLQDSDYISQSGEPRLVVRLGTKWFKNDGTIHYANTPESGAVEFVFDHIYGTASNGFNDTGGNYLNAMEGRQSHFYISLSQSLRGDGLYGQAPACLLAINGEFMSASSVIDNWDFLDSANPTKLNSGVGYTGSMWTTADTGSDTNRVFFFQAGNENDGTYLNEMLFSDIAIFSGSFQHGNETVTAMNTKVKNFCGGVTGTESMTDDKIGCRFTNYAYAKRAGSLTELSGPFLWWDFEKTNTGTEFDYSSVTFGCATASVFTSADNLISYYVYSGSSNSNIDGYVEPIAEYLRLDSGSFAEFVIMPGTDLDAYLVSTTATASTLVQPPNVEPALTKVLTSPDPPSQPIGGASGFNSFAGPGILQNSYSQFSRGLNLYTGNTIDAQLSASSFYSRRHSLTASTSVVNPFFYNLSSSYAHLGVANIELYLGTAFWDAPSQAGHVDATGSFISSPKEPFYDSYNAYAEEFRGIGKEYSIVPEFRVSNHIEHYLNNGPLATRNNILEMTGGLETLNDSSDPDFYKVYTNAEFLKNFDVVKQDHKKMFDPYKITLSCKAIKKFLPYSGFYPCERTTQLAQQFYSSYGSFLETTSAIGVDFGNMNNANYPTQYLLNPLFGPGVLFNTIKSGIACDYPIITSNFASGSSDDKNHFITSKFNTRIPFEALIEPEKYLANVSLFSNEPDNNANTKAEVLWNGQGDNLYKLQMNNFLAEVGTFFLENENHTTIASLPQGDPNFGNADGDKAYSLRVKMYRTITGSKEPAQSHDGIKFAVPQDKGAGKMGELFTMYSRPSSFGPPSNYGAHTFQVKAWNKYKKIGSHDFIYNTSSTYTNVTGANASDGYNFQFTPPYYHGEAWADIVFKPPSGTKKYTLDEIINNCSVEFCRFFESGSTAPPQELFSSGTIATNEQAMQIASSMNIFSRGILKSDAGGTGNVTVETQLENKYRWIMQTKFETPALNFNHHSHDSITMPNMATSSVPIGMWHQYGRLPQSTNEGIFVQIEDVPKNWIEGAMRGIPEQTGSLLSLCGFSTDPVRLGEMKDTKVIEEAIVAIPFVSRGESNTQFFPLNKKDVKNAVMGKEELVGETVADLVTKIKKYVLPPQFDFVNFKDVKPIAMYIFEFSHTLTKQDLSDIWQNLPPKIGIVHEKAEATISHELFSQEFFGTGAKLDRQNKLQKITDLSEISTDIRWFVFKVKKRARNNYFEKMFERNESGADFTSEDIVASTTGKKQKVGYNWPYDFFSMVELIKLDAGVELGNIDKEKSISLDQVFLKPTPPTREE